MHEFYLFADNHSCLAFMIIFFIALSVEQVIVGLINLPNRIIRHFNLRKNGWPPSYCDADGDFKKEET